MLYSSVHLLLVDLVLYASDSTQSNESPKKCFCKRASVSMHSNTNGLIHDKSSTVAVVEWPLHLVDINSTSILNLSGGFSSLIGQLIETSMGSPSSKSQTRTCI